MWLYSWGSQKKKKGKEHRSTFCFLLVKSCSEQTVTGWAAGSWSLLGLLALLDALGCKYLCFSWGGILYYFSDEPSVLWGIVLTQPTYISWGSGSWTGNVYGQLTSTMNGGFKRIWLIQAFWIIWWVCLSMEEISWVQYLSHIFPAHHKWGWVFQGWCPWLILHGAEFGHLTKPVLTCTLG